MNGDENDHDNGSEGFTEIQVEMSEELYHKAMEAAQAQGCSLDELVAELIAQETRRRAMEYGEGVGK